MKVEIETKAETSNEIISDKVPKSGRPIYEASLAWATESSPIVYESPEPIVAKSVPQKTVLPSFTVTEENMWIVKVILTLNYFLISAGIGTLNTCKEIIKARPL